MWNYFLKCWDLEGKNSLHTNNNCNILTMCGKANNVQSSRKPGFFKLFRFHTTILLFFICRTTWTGVTYVLLPQFETPFPKYVTWFKGLSLDQLNLMRIVRKAELLLSVLMNGVTWFLEGLNVCWPLFRKWSKPWQKSLQISFQDVTASLNWQISHLWRHREA